MRTRLQAPAPRLKAGRVAVGALCLAALALTAACRQDMHQAPRYDPLERSDFFADARASRPLVEGTVARGLLKDDARFWTGKDGATLVAEIPVPVTKELLVRGRERYDIYCSPCHSRTGDGTGMVVSRGFKQPPSYHIDRLRAQPVGYFYDVISSGFGAMQDYSAQLPPRDRWAIVAYVRALQLSRHAPASDLSPDDRAKLEGVAPVGRTSPHE